MINRQKNFIWYVFRSKTNWYIIWNFFRSRDLSAQICSPELSRNASEFYDQNRYPHNKVQMNMMVMILTMMMMIMIMMMMTVTVMVNSFRCVTALVPRWKYLQCTLQGPLSNMTWIIFHFLFSIFKMKISTVQGNLWKNKHILRCPPFNIQI